jgi:ribonuclease P protein component
MDYSYKKNERLCNKIIIEKLFNEGKSLYSGSLKLIWVITNLPEPVPAQTVINVSKRRFKRAVKRNLLRRRMKEAFRLNKSDLYTVLRRNNQQMALMILYNSNSINNYSQISEAMKDLLQLLINKLVVSV